MNALANTRVRYEQALEVLLDDVKQDPNILAAILCGSLAHDEVWEKSDIDLVLITTEGVTSKDYALTSDDINIHTNVMARSRFKQRIDSSTRNTFGHSLFAKAKLVYSKDPSIDQLFDELHDIGERDTAVQQMQALSGVLASLYKAQKWFEVKDDLDYAGLYILFTADSLAQLEVGAQGELVAREVIADAMKLNPEFFRVVYSEMLNRKKTRKQIGNALALIDEYLDVRRDRICRPIIDYLKETGEPRSVTEINHHFERHYNIGSVILICEWLADCGVIDKMSTPVKLTDKSRHDVEELAFFYLNPDF